MINGAHVLLYSDNAEADRAFFRDVLKWPHVDAGHGWLIFKLPPAEAAIHPSEMDQRASARAGHAVLGTSFYLMCDDLAAQIQLLKDKNVQCAEIAEERWGFRTTIRLPSGGEIGIYQPKHATAYDLP
jgi:hypothetical protein